MTPFALGHLPRMGRWLVPVWAVGALSLSFPVNRLAPLEQGIALLAAMGVIAFVVAASVRGVVLLLTDMALVTEELAGRMARILAQEGLPPVAGRMWAWLLVCDPPEQTAAQLAEAVGASRGSISGMASARIAQTGRDAVNR